MLLLNTYNEGFIFNIARKAIEEKDSDTFGYDALNDTYEDMLEVGIIDPVKVTKSALLNATSIASMLLTTEAAIVKFSEKQNLDLAGLLGK